MLTNFSLSFSFSHSHTAKQNKTNWEEPRDQVLSQVHSMRDPTFTSCGVAHAIQCCLIYTNLVSLSSNGIFPAGLIPALVREPTKTGEANIWFDQQFCRAPMLAGHVSFLPTGLHIEPAQATIQWQVHVTWMTRTQAKAETDTEDFVPLKVRWGGPAFYQFEYFNVLLRTRARCVIRDVCGESWDLWGGGGGRKECALWLGFAVFLHGT